MIQNKYTNQAITDYKSGKISQSEAIKRLQNIRRGASSVGEIDSYEKARQAEEAGRKALEQQAIEKAQYQAQKKLEEAKKQQEIEKLKQIQKDIKKNQETQFRNYQLEKNKNNQSFLSKVNKYTDEYLSPSGLYKLFGYGAEATLRTGEFLAEQDKKIISAFGGNTKLYDIKSPISRTTAKDIITSAYLFAGFEPLMRTGTVAKQVQIQKEGSGYVYDNVKKKFIKKSEVTQKDVATALSKSKNKPLTYAEKSNRVKILIDNLKKKDSASIKKVLETANEAYGSNFVKDFIQQEGYSQLSSTVPVTTTKASVGVKVTGVPATEMRGVSILETGSQLFFNPQRVGQTNWVNTINTPQLNQKPKTDQAQDSQTDQQQRPIVYFKTGQRQTPKVDQKVNQDSMVDQITNQIPNIAQIPKQVPKQDFIGQEYFNRPPQKSQPIKQPNKVIPSTKPLSLPKRLLKKAESEGFEVFGKRFGRDLSLGVFPTKRKAKQKLESFLVGTLGRSGFVEKGGKKVKLDLLGGMFRPAKKDPFRVVQKAKFSLGTSSEKSEIQYFKKKSSKRKKTKNVFGWL